jgi:hypothetical protein
VFCRKRGPATSGDRKGEQLFLGLVLLVLSVALFAVRTISEEERNVGFLTDQFLYSNFRRFNGIRFGPGCVLVLIQLIVSRCGSRFHFPSVYSSSSERHERRLAQQPGEKPSQLIKVVGA